MDRINRVYDSFVKYPNETLNHFPSPDVLFDLFLKNNKTVNLSDLDQETLGHYLSYLNRKQPKILQDILYDLYITSYYDDPNEFLNIFPDNDVFFDFLHKRNRPIELNEFDGLDSEIQLEYLKFLMKRDSDLFFNYFKRLFNIDVSDDGNNVYDIVDAESLSTLFCDRRNIISPEYIKDYLNGDLDISDAYYNSDSAYYVVSDLNEKNLNVLKDKILNNNANLDIEQETTFLIKNEITNINKENIDKILSDQETCDFIFSEYFSEINGNLNRIYHYASESTYLTTLHNKIFNELSEIFDKVTRLDNGDFKVEININTLIKNLDFEQYEYIGTLFGYIQDTNECLSIYNQIDDFPSQETINEYFIDYFE
jgi:hypothetical protein